jgi:hypothetical protein
MQGVRPASCWPGAAGGFRAWRWPVAVKANEHGAAGVQARPAAIAPQMLLLLEADQRGRECRIHCLAAEVIWDQPDPASAV